MTIQQVADLCQHNGFPMPVKIKYQGRIVWDRYYDGEWKAWNAYSPNIDKLLQMEAERIEPWDNNIIVIIAKGVIS